MAEKKLSMHYVCTHDEAKRLIEKNKEFWVSNCGCRESQKSCKRSRIDVCLGFKEGQTSTDHGLKELTREDAMEIFKEGVDKHLVTRPWRNEQRTETDGICFCCDCCCGYFLEDEKCDKGKYIENTDMEQCNHCGVCVDECYFDARKMDDDQLVITSKNCYGCGLCVDACATSAISMKKR